MFCNRPALVFLLLTISIAGLYGEDPPVVDETETEETETLSLYEKTLRKDIETAGYYELLAWLRTLGLPDQGSVETLQNQLYSHYSLSAEEVEPVRGSIITIKSARDTDYFTIEEKDQQMVSLSGDVEIEMEDRDSNRRHIIKADKLIFNQTENMLTATGNLEYRMISGESEDKFYGDSLTFSVDSWNGVIFKGSSLREETVDGEKRTFYFNGEMIRKSGTGGVFILEDGSVQTQDRDDPDFHLQAQRLWLMGPKEWGIRHGILYMGHVPVLYIPFYYKPGNEMIFNPVIGSDLRAGNFIQTTTYLIGRKDASENLAFFKLGDSNEKNYKLVRDGLYLMKTNEQPDSTDSEDTLKVMVDWYSRLGTFTGLDGSFKDKGWLDSLDFSSGLAVSRTISDSYDIYFSDDGEDYHSDWNSISWGDKVYPFRWKQTLDFKTDHLTATFQFYSDPFFNQDFMDREESFDWLNTILTTEMSDDDDPDEVSDMEWSLSYSNTFNPDGLTPFVERIAVSPLRFQMDWDNMDNEPEGDEDYYSSSYHSNDPAREFFYPESVNLPYAQVSMSGTPLSYSSREGWGWKKLKDEEGKEGEESLMPPWSSDEVEEKEKPEEKKEPFLAGEFWETRFSDYSQIKYQNSLSYSLSTLVNLESTTAYEDWSEPEDVDFDMEESLYISNNTFSTNLDNQFYDDTFGLTNVNDLSMNYRTHLNTLGANTDSLEYEDLLSDYQYRSLSWDNNLGAYYYPLKDYSSFSTSIITYTLDNMIYERSFDTYVDGEEPLYDHNWVTWDEEAIDQHSSGMELRYTPDYYSLTSSALFNLPPLDRKDTYTNTAAYDRYNWESSLSHSFYLEEEDWTFNPLIFKTSYTPVEEVVLEQSLEYSFEEETLSKSLSYIETWGFYLEYLMEYTTPYVWDQDGPDDDGNPSWVMQDSAFVPSSFSTGYKWDYVRNPFWKNRINCSTNLTLDWTVDLQQYNDNTLSFTWDYYMNINQFMDLTLSMTSSNKNMYLYIPYYRDKLGIDEEYSLLEDLFKSFNIFSPYQEDRYESYFNMEKVNLDLIHHLRDWDLTLSYSGWPTLEDYNYVWKSEFSIFLKWNPIPQIQTDIQYEDKQWLVDTE